MLNSINEHAQSICDLCLKVKCIEKNYVWFWWLLFRLCEKRVKILSIYNFFYLLQFEER